MLIIVIKISVACGTVAEPLLFLFQDCKLLTKQNKTISTNLAYKSRQVSSQVPFKRPSSTTSHDINT